MQLLATVELLVCWFAWAYPFLVRAPHRQKRQSITSSASTAVGLALECVAIFIAFATRLPSRQPPGMARLIGSMVLGPVAAALAWSAVKHLGRQFRVRAGLYVDHELVRTGAYSVVRHPIYASLLAILLSTQLLLTPWRWMLLSLALFLIGTEIRIRTEDRLLASRFGPEFEQYRRQVRAYVPLLR